MKWFRHYVGMTRDDKLMAVAARSRQPLDRVMFVWIAILESASERDDGGRYAVDAEMVAYTLRCEPADVTAIMLALEVAERLCEGVVVHWKDRQFESDTSRARMRRHREKQNGGGNGQKPHGDGDKKHGDVGVTSQNRTVTAPDSDSETDLPSPDGDGRPAAEPEQPKLRLVEVADIEPPPTDPDAALYRRGRQVLGDRAGGQITRLKAHFGGNIADARAAIEHAASRDRPAEYIGAILAKPSRGPPPRPSRTTGRFDIANEFLGRLDESRH